MASESKVAAANLTIDEISEYYQRYPISEAAQELGVGLTALKRRCREVGILRWPFRQLQSLDIMIKQLSEMDCVNAQRAADLARTEKFLLVHDPSRKMPETLRKLRQAQFKEKFTMVRMLLNNHKHATRDGDDDDDDAEDGGGDDAAGEGGDADEDHEEGEENGIQRMSAEEARRARAARAARRDRSKKRRTQGGDDIDEQQQTEGVGDDSAAGRAGGAAAWAGAGEGGEMYCSSWLAQGGCTSGDAGGDDAANLGKE